MFNLDPLTLTARLIVLFLGIPIHEWAHGYMAYLLGDDTPRLQGRLSLNPFMHLDPLGSLLILFSGFGWGRPALVNPYLMRKAPNPRMGFALSALAGPLSNFIQALIWALPIRLGLVFLLPSNLSEKVFTFLWLAISLNLALMLFNLLPIPPLDGGRVLAGVAPEAMARFIESLEPIAPLILIAVLFILPALGLDLVGVWIQTLGEPLVQAILGVK